METKANHIAVGSFVLLVVAGLIGFALWLGKAEIDREFDAYHIYFRGSVSGLAVASTVRYRGVPVGAVADIRIDPTNSERVRVTIKVTPGTPIKQDVVASLELRGITGLVDVQISGGKKDSPALEAKAGEPLPVIASTQSAIEELFEEVPNLLARATLLVERGTLLLSPANLEAIGETLQNVRAMSAQLADSTRDFQAMTDDIAAIAAAVRGTADQIETLTQDMSTRLPVLADQATATFKTAENTLATVGGSTAALTGDAQATLDQVNEAAASLASAATQLSLLVEENRPALKDFSGEGLYEMSRFLVEARELVASLARISDRFETDPARFMFGDSTQGYTPQ